MLLLYLCRRGSTSPTSEDTTDVQLCAREFDRFAALMVQVMIRERAEWSGMNHHANASKLIEIGLRITRDGGITKATPQVKKVEKLKRGQVRAGEVNALTETGDED
jgi:hypothetical protein